MKEFRRVIYLVLIMMIVSLVVLGIAISLLYRTALNENRARLVETAQSQARLIEAVARFDALYSRDYPGGSKAATLQQIIDAHDNYRGFGKTGEFTLAQREDDQIVFLLSHRHYDLGKPKPVPFHLELAEPMRRALLGRSGSIVGLDYRGEVVLAAYEPVAGMNLGIVAKIDLAEIRTPFKKAAMIAGIAALLVVLVGSLLFFRISNPMIRRLRTYSASLEAANTQLQTEIDDRKAAEKMLAKYAAELEQRNEELRNFSHLVSHDLRAPLLNLKGFGHELRLSLEVIASAMERALPHFDTEQQQAVTKAVEAEIPEALNFIDSSVTRLDKFSASLLKLARLGRREFTFKPIDMNGLVKQIIQSLSYQIENHNVRVAVGTLPKVVADQSSMEQIMGNLLTNAVLYLDADRPGVIQINAESGRDETMFSVRDNGQGISAEEVDKIFMPFRRAGKQTVEGEGMGLAFVRSLVRRHGGRIWCESKEGEGTVFAFTIPK